MEEQLAKPVMGMSMEGIDDDSGEFQHCVITKGAVFQCGVEPAANVVRFQLVIAKNVENLVCESERILRSINQLVHVMVTE